MATEVVVLNTGAKMPAVGLGTSQKFNVNPDEFKAGLKAALDAGYRHIDTAFMYGTEVHIGEVLQEYMKAGKVKREELFITTKLGTTYFEPDRVRLCLEKSLQNLQLDYVDLYLIHSPIPLRETGKTMAMGLPVDENGKIAFNHDVTIEDTWRAMQGLVKAGKAKAIGVSNFSIQHMERILKIGGMKPATNQVECHLYHQQSEMLEFLKKNGIVLTGYAPLGSPANMFKKPDDPLVMDSTVLKEVATKLKKTPAQILLRHLLQRGVVVIPKSNNPQRLKENRAVFDFKLADQEMERLNKENKNLMYYNMDMLLKDATKK